jgi:hypothetical protein
LVITTVMATILLVAAVTVIAVLVLSGGNSNESQGDLAHMFAPSDSENAPRAPGEYTPGNNKPNPPEDPPPTQPPGNPPPPPPPGNNGPSVTTKPNAVPSTNPSINDDMVKNLAPKAEYDAVIAAAEQYVKGTAGDIKGYKFGAAFTSPNEANVQYMKPDGSIYDLKLKKVGGTWKVIP